MVSHCPFCEPPQERVLWQENLVMVLRDGYPVSPGHTLIVPGRHFASFFEATQAEQEALLEGLREARALLARMHHADGFNVGLNDGLAAGQTVMHCHLHIIPRYTGDHPDPRGGVRWVLPAKARYWAD